MRKPVKIVLIVLGALLLVFLLLCIATVAIMKAQFSRGEYPDRQFYSYYWFDPDYSSTHTRENVQFQSGKNTLQGYLYGLENLSDDTAPAKGLIVFAHGISAGHESYINQLIWFADRGWVVFGYDATGSCTSEGEGTVGLVQSALDLDAALTFAEQDERFNELPICILGHSWGGFAVGGVQNFDHRLTAACTISGYAYPLEMLQVGAENSVGKPMAAVFRPFAWGYNKAVFGKYADLNAVDGINHSGIPVLVLHGDADDTVPYENISIFSKQAEITNPNVRYETITGPYANHNSFFSSDAANVYKKEFNARIQEIEKQSSGKVQEDRIEAEYLSLDKPLINEVNEDLLNLIEQFYLDAIAAE